MLSRVVISNKIASRCMSTGADVFYHKDIVFQKNTRPQAKPTDVDSVPFGKIYTDHMVDIDWERGKGWAKPQIRPFANFKLHPAAKVFHSALELFEGIKAYYGVDGQIRVFRPDLNMERMRRTGARCCFPDFNPEEALKILLELVHIDSSWVPRAEGSSLYLRPTMIGTEPIYGLGESKDVKMFMICSPVGKNYFNTGGKGVKLLADTSFVRAWPGGVGSFKMGCNYAPTIYVQHIAAQRGCHQVMWLQGKEKFVTEAGAMNLFMLWKNEQGEDELLTAPLESDVLLPGITRRSILELAREWKEFKVSERQFTMDEVIRAVKEKRIYEFFTAGTAAVIGAISEIHYVDKPSGTDTSFQIPTLESKTQVHKRMYDTITGVQYGRVQKDGWVQIVKP